MEDRELRCVRGCCVGTAARPLAVRPEELELGGEVARGATSVVRRGTWRGRAVAVKVPALATGEALDRFHQELGLLTRLRGAHVSELLAAQAHPPRYAFVTALEEGNLAQRAHERGWRPRGRELFRTAVAVADGLLALHALGYVHRDVKPANVLYSARADGGAEVKLTDFGLAEEEATLLHEHSAAGRSSVLKKGKPTGGFHKRHMVGTLEYLAPEVLMKRAHTRKADVYAFAVAINELATRVYPFSDCHKERPGCHTVLEMGYGHQELRAAVAGDALRPTLAADAPGAFNRLVERCWALAPADRPDLAEVRAALAALHDAASDDAAPVGVPRAVPAGPGSDPAASPVAAVPAAVPAAGAFRGRAAAWRGGGGLYRPVVDAGFFQTQGRREHQEDRQAVHTGLGGDGAVHLVGVFDGHRGSAAAEFCANHLASFCYAAWFDAGSAAEVLRAAFVNMDVAFRVQRGEDPAGGAKAPVDAQPPEYPGATAAAALIVDDMLYLANAGDCRAILSTKGAISALSTDHNTGNAAERARVLAAGGTIALKYDTLRVGEAAIQVTRSIGDGDLKNAGVTAEPEVAARRLTADDEWLVLATDGLWDVLSHEDVGGMIRDTVKQPAMVGQRLVMEALTRGSADNITCIVVFLSKFDSWETIYKDGRESHAYQSTHYGTRNVTHGTAAGAGASTWAREGFTLPAYNEMVEGD